MMVIGFVIFRRRDHRGGGISTGPGSPSEGAL
jgi:hypothetical protein